MNLELLQAGKIDQVQFKQMMKFVNYKVEATTQQPIIAVLD